LGVDFDTLTAAFNAMAARLQTVEDTRRQLLADLGHEMRTPLSTIEGYLDAAEDGIMVPDEDTLAVLRTQTARLRRLAEDLTAVTNAQEHPIDRRPVAPNALIHTPLAAARPGYDDKGVDLRQHTAPDLPVLAADPQRLDQVLANLLDNARRHSPPGGHVTVTARHTQGQVHISVADTGAGIAPEHLPHVFERFYRADTARDRRPRRLRYRPGHRPRAPHRTRRTGQRRKPRARRRSHLHHHPAHRHLTHRYERLGLPGATAGLAPFRSRARPMPASRTGRIFTRPSGFPPGVRCPAAAASKVTKPNRVSRRPVMISEATHVAGMTGWRPLALLWALMMALALWGIARLLPAPRRPSGPVGGPRRRGNTDPGQLTPDTPVDPGPQPELTSRTQRCPVVGEDHRGALVGRSALPASPPGDDGEPRRSR